MIRHIDDKAAQTVYLPDLGITVAEGRRRGINLKGQRAVGLSGWWSDFLNYNSADSWGTSFADAYQWLQYGTLPPLVKPAAGETPQQIAERQRQAIIQAEKDGTWTSDARLGVTATDIDNARKTLDRNKWLLLAAAVGVGVVAVKLAGPRR